MKKLACGLAIGVALLLAVALIVSPRLRGAVHGAALWALNLHQEETRSGVVFTCPMHLQIKLPQPGDCPICGMSLVKRKSGEVQESGRISLSDRQIQLAGVRRETIRRRNLTAEIDTVGHLDYDERKLAYVSSWVAGRIEKLHVDFTGMTIQKGHALVDIYSPDLITDQQGYLQALATLEAIRSSGRAESIANQERLVASSRQRLLWWGLTVEQVKGIERTREVRAQLTLLAPIGGTVIHKNAFEGMYVKEGTQLFQIAELDEVWMYADIYESELPLLFQPHDDDYYACPMHPEESSPGPGTCPECGMDLIRQCPGVKVEITTQAYPEETFPPGKVEFTDPFVSPQTRTLRIRCTIPNPALKLRPDMYVRARIKLEQGELLAVPESAVIHSGTRQVVIVDEGEGSFRPTLVRLGRRWLKDKDRDYSEQSALPFHRGMQRYHEVLGGLREGETVVVAGNFLLNSESKLQGALDKMIQEAKEEEARPAAGEMTELLQRYLELQEAMANAEWRRVAPLAAELAELEHGAIARTALELARQSDQEGIVRAFARLTEALVARRDVLPDGVYQAYCSMEKKRWLQRGKTIRNPYAPKRMPRCGRIVADPEQLPREGMYTCSMHPSVLLADPGDCPSCGMTLEPTERK